MARPSLDPGVDPEGFLIGGKARASPGRAGRGSGLRRLSPGGGSLPANVPRPSQIAYLRPDPALPVRSWLAGPVKQYPSAWRGGEVEPEQMSFPGFPGRGYRQTTSPSRSGHRTGATLRTRAGVSGSVSVSGPRGARGRRHLGAHGGKRPGMMAHQLFSLLLGFCPGGGRSEVRKIPGNPVATSRGAYGKARGGDISLAIARLERTVEGDQCLSGECGRQAGRAARVRHVRPSPDFVPHGWGSPLLHPGPGVGWTAPPDLLSRALREGRWVDATGAPVACRALLEGSWPTIHGGIPLVAVGRERPNFSRALRAVPPWVARRVWSIPWEEEK